VPHCAAAWGQHPGPPGSQPAGSAPDRSSTPGADTGRAPPGPGPVDWHRPPTRRVGSAPRCRPCRDLGGRPRPSGALFSQSRFRPGPARRWGPPAGG
jgi:hypothetical protein